MLKVLKDVFQLINIIIQVLKQKRNVKIALLRAFFISQPDMNKKTVQQRF